MIIFCKYLEYKAKLLENTKTDNVNEILKIQQFLCH